MAKGNRGGMSRVDGWPAKSFVLAPSVKKQSCKWDSPLRVASLGASVATMLFGSIVIAADISEDRQKALVNLLRHDCGACHGMTLRGGLGPPLTAASLDGKPREALEATILRGRPGTPMPPWRTLLSESDVSWLVQTLKSGNLE